METSVYPELFAKTNGRREPPSPPPAAADGAAFEPEDFGPETDVDAPEEQLILSQNLAAAKAVAAKSPLPGSGGEVWVPHKKLQKQQENWLMTLPWSYADAVRKKPKPKEEPPAPPPPPPTPPKVEELVSDVVEAEAVESEDDSDGEWNYIKGEDKEIEQKPDEELSESDMESRLNPNAAEFVPSLPLDPVISSSPKKGSEVSMENVKVPPLKDFLDEISHRPADLECLGDAESDLPKNKKDEFELLFNKVESKEEIGASDNVPPSTITEEEKLSSPKVETNPFFSHEDKENGPFYTENERTDFIKDHFAAPSEESTDQQVTSSILEDHALSPNTDLGSLHSDLVKNVNEDSNVQTGDADSPYDFVFNCEKSDVGSPVDQLINAEPNSSSGFDSGSNEEIETNSQSKFVSDVGIMFGDGVDIDEIRKLKIDSPEEKIITEDERGFADERPVTSSDSILPHESSTQEVLPPIVDIQTTTPDSLTPFDNLISSAEPAKKDEEREHLESPSEEELKPQEELVDILPKEQNEAETIPVEVSVNENDTNLTVDFIQELQFNETVKIEESQKKDGYLELSESELEASFEIISHEATKELDFSEVIVAKESLPVDEKSLMDQNEMEKEGVLEMRPDSVVGDLLDQIVSSKQEICDILKQEVTHEREEDNTANERLLKDDFGITSENERLVKDDFGITEPGAISKDNVEEHLEGVMNQNSIDMSGYDCKANNDGVSDDVNKDQFINEEVSFEVSSDMKASDDNHQVMPEEEIGLEIKQPEVNETTQTVDVSAATPPPTPAPGSDDKHELVAAAFGVLGTAALVAGTASLLENEKRADDTEFATVEKTTNEVELPDITKSQETDAEKPVDLKKTATSAIQKKPAPGKTAPLTASKPASKPASKASTSTVQAKKPTTVSPTKPLQGKPSTGSAKPSTPTTSTKPTTPTTTKPATPTASKPTTPTTAKPATTTAKMASKPLNKPPTPVNKSATSVPSKAAPKPASQATSKPKVSEVNSKPISKATGTSSVSAAAKPKTSAPVASKPAPIAKTGVDKASVKKDEPLVKKAVPAAKPPAATKVSSTTRPGSAGAPKSTSTTAPSKAPPKAAPATKPVAAAAKPSVTSTTKSAPSASTKPPGKATAPAAKPAPATQAKPKVPATTVKAKPAAKGAPNDKSVKDAANNKLTAKSVPKKVDSKSVKDVPEKKVIAEDKSSELVTQENNVTTTNGHLDIIENGIQNGNGDSPIDKPHLEIIEAQLI